MRKRINLQHSLSSHKWKSFLIKHVCSRKGVLHQNLGIWTSTSHMKWRLYFDPVSKKILVGTNAHQYSRVRNQTRLTATFVLSAPGPHPISFSCIFCQKILAMLISQQQLLCASITDTSLSICLNANSWRKCVFTSHHLTTQPK